MVADAYLARSQARHEGVRDVATAGYLEVPSCPMGLAWDSLLTTLLLTGGTLCASHLQTAVLPQAVIRAILQHKDGQ